MNFIGIKEFNLPGSFKSKNGNDVQIVGTASSEINKNANGWCSCSRGYKEFGVCWNCYLNETYDMIKVNGKHVPGCYRRGTVLKIAGCRIVELGLICVDDNVIVGRLFEELFSQFAAGAVKDNYEAKDAQRNTMGIKGGQNENEKIGTVDDNNEKEIPALAERVGADEIIEID